MKVLFVVVVVVVVCFSLCLQHFAEDTLHSLWLITELLPRPLDTSSNLCTGLIPLVKEDPHYLPTS